MKSLLMQYIYLQSLDVLTTMAFLRNGVAEANPIVRALLQGASSPLHGLLIVKFLAIALGLYCWQVQKYSLLAKVNVCYAILVAWNLLALIAGSNGGETHIAVGLL